jgi:hypothetical protein
MTRSNQSHEANERKSTAQLTTQPRTDLGTETNADRRSACPAGRQVRSSAFDFLPASQLRRDDRDTDGDATEGSEGGER